MSEIPVKTGIPSLVDTTLTNSFDFHLAATKFGKVVDEYADYIAAVYIWNHSKQTGDPIVDEANFFANLNLGMLNVKTNHKGTITGGPPPAASPPDPAREPLSKTIKSKTQLGYWLAKLDTLLRPSETWIRGEGGLPDQQSLSNGNTRYHAINLHTGTERWIEYKDEDTITDIVNDKLETLSDQWGLDDMSAEFMIYWYEKFQNAHYKVKEEYKKLITDDTIDYFTEASDSIGTLSRTFEGVDSTCIPMLDLNFKILDTVPSVVPPVVSDKLDKQTQILLSEMSMKTNAIFRRNIIQVLDTISTQNKSHSENLTSDYKHWTRCKITNIEDIGIVSDTIGQVYKILNYNRLAINQQEVVSPVYEAAIEDSMIRVNFLNGKVKTLRDVQSALTNADVLKAKPENAIDLS